MATFDGGERFAVPGNLEADSDPEPGSTGSDDHSTSNPMAEGNWPSAPGVAPGLSSIGEFAVPGNPPEGSEPVPSGSDRSSPTNFSGWPQGEDRLAVNGNPEPNSDPEPNCSESTSY